MEITISKDKKFQLKLVILIFFIILIWAVVDFHNDEHISFSRESGYYDDAFELKISGGGYNNSIYYTLDGSEPTQEDYLYSRGNPIYLTDATDKANIYSMRTDTSVGFQSDLINEYALWEDPEYTVPDYNVDKCNIVRASVFDKQGNCLDSITGVYFIGFREKMGYENIYTASIVTEPNNLFGYETGIYITGIAFDQYVSGGENSWAETPWTWWNSNYKKRGIEWEREALVTVFNKEREVILSENCGIRIQGGLSRAFLPRSIGCYAREQYGGRSEFQTALFQTNKYPHKFVFFSGGNDNIFKLKDCLVHTLVRELNFATMDFIPCAVFLDGEYWGIYYITENYNKDYISDHYNVKKDNVIMIKNSELSEGNEGEELLFDDMKQYILQNDMSCEENYERACELIDMESYIDYYAALIYLARYVGDWPCSNWAVWRVRENDGSSYGDCRWRWMLFDVNSGETMSSSEIDYDTFSYILTEDTMFYALYQNDEFKRQFAEKILYIGKVIFAENNYNTFLDDYCEKMKEPIAISNQRFYNDFKIEGFIDNIEDVREFLDKRYDTVWDSLKRNMGEEWLERNGIQK